MSRFIQIDFSQLSNILDDLQKVGDRAADLKPVARLVGLVISSYTDEVFNSAPSTQSDGTVFNGEVWKKLSDKYLKARNRSGKKSKSRDNGFQLRDTGALLNSLQSNSTTTFSPRSASNFFESGNDFIEFGTNLPQGFNNNSRAFLKHTDDLTELVAKALENYIITGET
jgi:phage gpG-like protein